MSSYPQKKAPMFESLPCPECGKIKMHMTIEDCVLGDGTKVKKLNHFKCSSCGARFFDDKAMHVIQAARTTIPKVA